MPKVVTFKCAEIMPPDRRQIRFCLTEEGLLLVSIETQRVNTNRPWDFASHKVDIVIDKSQVDFLLKEFGWRGAAELKQ